MPRIGLTQDDDRPTLSIQRHQLAATAAPDRRTTDLIGNFTDFDSLFEQLAEPQIIELGRPLPKAGYMPKRVGSCPAAHNRRLASKA